MMEIGQPRRHSLLSAKGVAGILLACTIWGFATLYYKALSHVPPMEVLAHRTLWTLVFFGALLAVQRRLSAVPALLTGPLKARIIGAAAIVSVNWGLFIWAIQSGHAVQASLGYYILPLVSVLLGVVLLGERLPDTPAGDDADAREAREGEPA